MKIIWMEDEKESTEYHAWNRDTIFLVHGHTWATGPVKPDL